MSTQDLVDLTQPGQPLFGLNTTNEGRIVIFAGGILLERDGEVVGAIGVSGGTVEQDQEVAEATIAYWGLLLAPLWWMPRPRNGRRLS
jgi:uncharacterized protein GlcG (DUF336 family)